MKTETLLWLDDYRNPIEGQWLVFSPLKSVDYEVHWVKDYKQFIDWINTNGLPSGICFDHDLSDFQAWHVSEPEYSHDVPWPESEKTGMDCAKWLVEYCLDNNLKLPIWNIQSANPVGAENIRSLLTQFENEFK